MRGAVAFNNIFIKPVQSGWWYQKAVLLIVTGLIYRDKEKETKA